MSSIDQDRFEFICVEVPAPQLEILVRKLVYFMGIRTALRRLLAEVKEDFTNPNETLIFVTLQVPNVKK